ncbi:MAG: class I mannose-6-phosphate isomerase [Limnochordales bacterium]|nr:class I mannose-6-phosphate isomerase [Limnochordales bacterium]
MYPLKFDPIYKEKIWGGDALARLFGRKLPSGRVGESWEIAAHPHGQSIVSNGPLAGRRLVDLLHSHRDEIMGKTPLSAGERFPLLVKLLDCNDWLSVQVHPDDEYARIHEGDLGKTESWLVLYAAPGAQIVYGLKPGTTRQEFAAAIAGNRVEDYLHKVNVRAGDVFSVPAGTVHALGRGVVVAEIQQNSDTVYRVYDWGRLGDDGKPRKLHVEKALDVINFDFSPIASANGRRAVTSVTTAATDATAATAATAASKCSITRLDANDKYVIERIELTGEWSPPSEDRFVIFMLLQGSLRVAGGGEELWLRAGESLLVPAAVTDLRLAAGDAASAVLLRAYVP